MAHGLLIAVASLVAEHGRLGSRRTGLRSCGSRALSAGSVVVAHGFSRSTACGIFPAQGSNLCSLH